ncbi:hypothetical protein CHH69_18240, partial [Terribacillus saccharophilus]
MGNLFVPFKESNGQTYAIQIDHLIVLPSGIYIIETKFWRGKVYHGISKEQANELGHVMDLLYPDEKKNQECTFVILDDLTKDEYGKEKKQVRVQDYGDPARQVKKTAVTLSKELAKHNYKLYIQTILYFAYKEDEINNVINHSIQESPEVISNERALGNYIE